MKNKKLGIILAAILGLLIIATVVCLLVFRGNKITVSFVDGETVISTLNVKKGEKINLPGVEREGYDLEGWYYNNEKLRDGVFFTENAIVIARWLEQSKPTMRIVFDTDGGKDLEPITIECDSELKLPTPTRDGYKFVNWLDKNEVIISNETKLACEDVSLKAKWEKEEATATPTTKPTPTPTTKPKEYTCPNGYTLNGTKCTIEGTVREKCPSDTKADGTLCIRTSDSNGGDRVCKSDTVSIDGKGHTWTGQGDYYFFGNSYGKCAYYWWQSYTTQSQCEGAHDINHKTTWVSELGKCYAETKMNNYETVCSGDYQYYSSDELSSKFGIHDGGKCLRKVSKEKYCDSGYTLTNNKCIKTIDATEK